jgi:hypothetical protein
MNAERLRRIGTIPKNVTDECQGTGLTRAVKTVF